MKLRRIFRDAEADRALLRRVVLESSAYFELVEGSIPDASAMVEELFEQEPVSMGSEAERCVYLLEEEGRPMGLVDLLRGWKHPRQSMIGLLLIVESAQGRGLGRRACALLEDEVRAWPEMDSLRLGVNLDNARGLAFWQGLGFVATGERTHIPPQRADVVLFEKSLR